MKLRLSSQIQFKDTTSASTILRKSTLMNLISKLFAVTVSITTGIIVGIQTAHECCVEDRPDLGWLVGILGTVVLGSLLYTLQSESQCVWNTWAGRSY